MAYQLDTNVRKLNGLSFDELVTMKQSLDFEDAHLFDSLDILKALDPINELENEGRIRRRYESYLYEIFVKPYDIDPVRENSMRMVPELFDADELLLMYKEYKTSEQGRLDSLFINSAIGTVLSRLIYIHDLAEFYSNEGLSNRADFYKGLYNRSVYFLGRPSYDELAPVELNGDVYDFSEDYELYNLGLLFEDFESREEFSIVRESQRKLRRERLSNYKSDFSRLSLDELVGLYGKSGPSSAILTAKGLDSLRMFGKDYQAIVGVDFHEKDVIEQVWRSACEREGLFKEEEEEIILDEEPMVDPISEDEEEDEGYSEAENLLLSGLNSVELTAKSKLKNKLSKK